MVKRKNRRNGDSRAFHALLSLLCSATAWALQKVGYGRHTRSWFRGTNGCDSITRVIQKKLGWTMYYPSSDTRTGLMTSGTANNLKRVTFPCSSANFLRVWMSADAIIVWFSYQNTHTRRNKQNVLATERYGSKKTTARANDLVFLFLLAVSWIPWGTIIGHH